ncbi:MAG: aspartate--tRNA(Asn) ligase [Christensenellaceae bacterium]|jgi:aspartyl-tRNA synthetase|nr:aspartate--tRNA(Asn) ligase [Christensenellaceae bacterium]
MKRTQIKDIKEYDGQVVIVSGFVQEIRNLKSMQFLVLKDITGAVQITVFKKPDNAELNQIVNELTVQSSVSIKGLVHVDSFVKLNGVEIIPSQIIVANKSIAPLPIDLSGITESGRDLRLDWRFLDLRDKKRQLIFRVQTICEMAMREYWINNGFIEIHSPKLVPNPSESGAELFELEYFGRKAYLAQSPQTYKQMAIASGFERVFEIGPVFRANKSSTNRHDTEFTSVDCEFAWIDSVEDVMEFEEKWIHYFLTRLKETLGDEIKEVFGREVIVPTLPFPRITMSVAKEIIKSLNYEVPPETKGDLDPTAERLIGKYFEEKHQHQFVFVTEFPVAIRPFYHMFADDKKSTLSFDLLWNGLEVTTGAQREHRYLVIIKQAIEKGLISCEAIDDSGNVVEDKIPIGLKSYLDCFNYGCPPHGGYGFGLTRMLMNILGYENVREVTYVYRGVDRLYP